MHCFLHFSGMAEDRHVFSSDIFGEKPPFSPSLKQIINKYGALSNNLKADYFKKCAENQDTFVKYGWVYSDYFLDGIDGKQLTITTYI